MTLKPRPNDTNISKQHIPTLLAQHLQAPVRQSQHLNAIYRNIVGCNMLHTFGYPATTERFATCCELKIEIARMPRCNIVARTWPNDYNITQHPQMLSPGQTIATYQRNMSQHCWAQNAACVWPPCCGMLGVVGSNLKMVKFEPTTPNMSQHITTRWPNARKMLRPTMLRYVALACCDRLAGALHEKFDHFQT